MKGSFNGDHFSQADGLSLLRYPYFLPSLSFCKQSRHLNIRVERVQNEVDRKS